MKQFVIPILAVTLTFAGIAHAVNVSVPQSTGYGQVLIGNAAGGGYTPVATSTLGISSSGGSGTISTSSPLTSGQPLYATGVNTIASVASSTFLTSIGGQPAGSYATFGYLFPGNATTTNITFSNGLTGTLTGNADTVTNGVYTTGAGSVYEVPLTFNYPLSRSVNAVSVSGMATGTISNGTGISVTAGQYVIGSGLTITNTAPDQTVAFTNGTGINVTGTYPNFTVTNTSPQTFSYPFPSNATSTQLSFTAGTTTVVNLHATGNLQVDGVAFAPVTLVNSGNVQITGTLAVLGQTTLATSLTGLAYTNAGVVSAITNGTIGTTGVLGLSSGAPAFVATSTLYGAAPAGGYVLGWNNTTNGIGWVATSTSGTSLTGSTGQIAYFSGTDTAVGTSTISIGVDTGVTMTPQKSLYGVDIEGTARNEGVQFGITVDGTIDNNADIFGQYSAMSLKPAVNLSAYGNYYVNLFTKAGSGTHPLLANAYFATPVVLGSGATITDTANLYVQGAMSATVTGNKYAIWSAAGVNRFDGGILSTASSTFTGTLSLATSTAGCLNTSANGLVYAATCASGSVFPFTVNTGYNSTSTVISLAGGFMAVGSSTLPSLGTGLVKVTNGLLGTDTSTYLTANQSITLSGAVSGSGTTAITTSYAGMLGNTLGGTGKDSSAFTGIAMVSAGGWYATATSSAISLNISGNAGTVTNGVYTSTFNGLFDTRLSATTTLPNLTTLLGLTNASTTQFTAGTNTFYVDSTGHITAKDTPTGYTGVVSPLRRLTLATATTTAWTATTSSAILQVVMPFAGTIRNALCHTDVGTVNIDVYHTTTHLSLFNASTTVGTVNWTANNTVTAGEILYMVAGTPASSPTSVSCTLGITET